MKNIKINESQFRRLFEDREEIIDGDDSVKRFASENGIQAIVTDKDGEEDYSEPFDTKPVARAVPDNNFMRVGGWRTPNITM